MNQKENQGQTKPASEIEDLTVEESTQQEVKGGNRGSASNNTVYFTNDYSLTL